MADFITSGSPVADTVQQILQRRRDDRRQGVLDRLRGAQLQDEFLTNELNRQQTQDQMKTAALNRDILTEQLLQQQAGSLQDDAAIGNQPQQLQDFLRNRGYTRQITPHVGTSSTFQGAEGVAPQVDTTTDAGPSQEVFISPTERLRRKMLAETEGYISNHPELKDNPLLTQQLRMRAELGTPLTPELMGPRPTFQLITPSGKAGALIKGDYGTQAMQSAWSPASYAQPTISPLGVNDKGELVLTTNRLDKNGRPVIFNEPGFNGLHKLGTGESTTATQIIPPTIVSNIQRASQAKNGQIDIPALVQSRNSALMYVNEAARKGLISPKVASLVTSFNNQLNNMQTTGKKMPTVQDLEAQIAAAGLTPEEASSVRQFGTMFANPGIQQPSGGLINNITDLLMGVD